MSAPEVPLGNTTEVLPFLMVDSSDHVAGKTGLTPTVTISKNGGAFAAPAGAVAEIGEGLYKLLPAAADADTEGPLILHAEAVGADPTDAAFVVVDVERPFAVGVLAAATATSVTLPVGTDPAVSLVGMILWVTAGGADDYRTIEAQTVDAQGRVVVSWGVDLPWLTVPSAGDRYRVLGNPLRLPANVRRLGIDGGGNLSGTVGGLDGVTFPANFDALAVNASGEVTMRGAVALDVGEVVLATNGTPPYTITATMGGGGVSGQYTLSKLLLTYADGTHWVTPACRNHAIDASGNHVFTFQLAMNRAPVLGDGVAVLGG